MKPRAQDRPRILLVVDAYPGRDHIWDGVFFQDQAVALARHATVGVALPRTWTPRQLWSSGQRIAKDCVDRQQDIDVFRFTSFVPTARSDRLLTQGRLRSLRRAIHRFERVHGPVDLIHAHCAAFAGETAVRVARQCHMPVVLTEHYSFLPELVEQYGQRLIDVYSEADAVFAVSRSLAERMKNLGIRQDVECMPNAVDTSVFTHSPITPPREGPWQLLCVARDAPVKDLATLVRALAQLSELHDVHLTLVGEGEYRSLREQLDEQDCRDRVRFAGDLTRPELASLMKRSHVIVSSSRTETFGMSLAEGLCIGRPVAATDSGGPRDIVRPADGKLVSIQDASALAAAIADVLNHYHHYDQSEIATSAHARFGQPAFASRMLTRYANLMQKQMAGPPPSRLESLPLRPAKNEGLAVQH